MKRLSIFDLQEGKVYNAFDGDRQLGKRYTVQNGQLMNANKDENPHDLTVYENCEWVPLKASIGFEEVKQPATPVTILALKHGVAYKPSAQINGLVARNGNRLMLLDNNHKAIKPVDLAIISLSTMFTAVAEITAKAFAKKSTKVSKSLLASKRKPSRSRMASASR